MKTITINDIIASTNGTAILAPVLTQAQHPVEWAQAIARDSVLTKNGREISAARSALNGAQFSMTNIAMALRCATELGVMPFTHAVSHINRIYNLLDGLRSGFAGVRQEAHRELVIADITIEVKDGCFAEMQSTSDAYTREELEDLARSGSLDWDAIDDIMGMQEAKQATGQSELSIEDDDWSESEGEYRSSIHEAKQLWDIELKDIRFAEMAAARVALIGIAWPTRNQMWEPLLERLAESWAASIEYADTPADKEDARKKVARREQAVDDLWVKPQYARWAINHVTRRVFRDIEVLKLKQEEAEDRLSQSERQAMNEERYGVPASMTRVSMGETTEYERRAYLLYHELVEADTAGATEHENALERDRSWYAAITSRAGELIEQLLPLYKELRAMDVALTKMWALFATDGRPTAPPVYWNMTRTFSTDEVEEARLAIRAEAAMAKQKARAAEGDALVKAAALVAQMLGL